MIREVSENFDQLAAEFRQELVFASNEMRDTFTAANVAALLARYRHWNKEARRVER